MLEGFHGALCTRKLTFFLPLSEDTAMSLNGLNYLSLLLTHDGTRIFRKQIIGFVQVSSFPSSASLSTCHILFQFSLFMGLQELPSSL